MVKWASCICRPIILVDIIPSKNCSAIKNKNKLCMCQNSFKLFYDRAGCTTGISRCWKSVPYYTFPQLKAIITSWPATTEVIFKAVINWQWPHSLFSPLLSNSATWEMPPGFTRSKLHCWHWFFKSLIDLNGKNSCWIQCPLNHFTWSSTEYMCFWLFFF